jgi:hypothetical protein
MRPSRRTATVTLAAALGLGSIIGLASPALAEGPQGQEMVLSLPPHTDPQPAPTDLSTGDDTPDLPPPPAQLPQPNPDLPDGPAEVEQPETLPEPHPQPQPDPEPECNPHLASCDKGTEEPECEPILASCDLTDRPAEPGGDETDDPEVDVEVEGEATERGALPRTGASLLVLGAAGGALTGVGAALRRIARR